MRRPGRQLIETWRHHRYKDEVSIYIEKSDGSFHATYGDINVNSKTLEGIRKELEKLVEETTNLEWIPVIMVNIEGQSYFCRNEKVGPNASTEKDVDQYSEKADKGSARLTLNFNRFWLTKNRHGVWMQCDVWYSEDEGGKSDHYDARRSFNAPLPRRLNTSEFYEARMNKDFNIPYTCKTSSFHERDSHYVKYTPELWAGLNEVAFKLEELTEKLETLLGSEQGLKLVEGLVGKLLPPIRTKKQK